MALIFMKEFINNVKRDRITFNLFIISFIVLLISVFIILINFKNIPPLIPIFNQLPWGDQRLTPSFGIFIPIILLVLTFIFNFGFSSFLYSKNNPLLGRIIASVTLLVTVMNFIFILKTLLLII